MLNEEFMKYYDFWGWATQQDYDKGREPSISSQVKARDIEDAKIKAKEKICSLYDMLNLKNVDRMPKLFGHITGDNSPPRLPRDPIAEKREELEYRRTDVVIIRGTTEYDNWMKRWSDYEKTGKWI